MTSPRPHALITGASRGIGRAIALELARTHDLTCTARNKDALASVARDAEAAGARVRTIAVDLAHADAVTEALADVACDVLVNNAGVATLKPFLQLSPDEWSAMLDVNVNALFHVTRAVLPGMTSRGRGHVITIGSTAGRNTFAGGSCYVGTKHFVMGFSECLMLEVRDQGVKVSVVMPGSVETELVPSGTDTSWMIQPSDVALAVRHLVDTPPHVLQYIVEVRPLTPKRRRDGSARG
ncbi:MAG: SDR family NAD(P)-dependent oxidoreductase [Gemmatimonadaceae bacterium]|jgi:3-oxoacyl-[acyl-carrier protein] reductase|nr:SDR family NAD(P)-dependent oxidoreductase [Gemmatimonadaceae bacterium]